MSMIGMLAPFCPSWPDESNGTSSNNAEQLNLRINSDGTTEPQRGIRNTIFKGPPIALAHYSNLPRWMTRRDQYNVPTNALVTLITNSTICYSAQRFEVECRGGGRPLGTPTRASSQLRVDTARGLWKLHLMIELRKANHIPAAATAVAIEECFVGIDQEAWLVIFMQRAKPYPPAATERPCGVPIMRLQILHQRNLLLQLVERLAIHGLLASTGRIRHNAPRSQARMVGACRNCLPRNPAFTQHQILSNRQCAQRRRVDGSGERDGSLQCGGACSSESPAAIRSHACRRQSTLKCPEGASQSGRAVNVVLHG